MSDISIILIRHGEAAASWSKDPDPGLSDNGHEQAESLLIRHCYQDLSGYQFISSPKLRAIETSNFLAKKFSKDVKTNSTYSEIPSTGILMKDKMEWLGSISSMPIEDLPLEVAAWRKEIITSLLSIKNNTIIFSHFMVMNVLASYANGEQRLLSFYPDYTSFIKIVLRNGSIYSIEFDKEKKTKINI
jgi:probable phosphoglycerate mutase